MLDSIWFHEILSVPCEGELREVLSRSFVVLAQ